MSRTEIQKIRNVWRQMNNRCQKVNNKDYANYGARGIAVCDRWNPDKGGSFENFLDDMGMRPAGMKLDRIDNDGDYCKDNCRWTTQNIQTYNQRRKNRNTSGRTGVSFHKPSGNWVARITVGGNLIQIGSYKTKELAIKARESAEEFYYGVVKE